VRRFSNEQRLEQQPSNLLASYHFCIQSRLTVLGFKNALPCSSLPPVVASRPVAAPASAVDFYRQ